MPRTPEQVEADQKLTEAIENCIAAYKLEEGFLLSDYMVIVASSRIDDEGETESAYSYIYRDNNMPYHRIIGLLELAQARAKYNMNKECEK